MNRVMCAMYMLVEEAGRSHPEEGWCAVDGPLDPNALIDSTLCGQDIIMRGGSDRRVPTCPDCLEVLRKRGGV